MVIIAWDAYDRDINNKYIFIFFFVMLSIILLRTYDVARFLFKPVNFLFVIPQTLPADILNVNFPDI